MGKDYIPLSLAILNWHVVHVGKILCTLHTSIMGNTILGNRNLGCRSSVVTEVHQLHFQQMQPLVFFTKASERYWLGISSCHMHLCFTCTICTDLTELPLRISGLRTWVGVGLVYFNWHRMLSKVQALLARFFGEYCLKRVRHDSVAL